MKTIIAVLPIFIKGKGICSQIYYEDKIVTDRRSCENVLKNLCDANNISKKTMKRTVKSIIKIKRNMPWVIDQNHVFFPVTINVSEFPELRRGFINCNFVKEIEDNDVVLVTDERIRTLVSQEALNTNLVLANYLMYRLKYQNLKNFIIGDGIGLKAKILQDKGYKLY
ncbi:MAG: competence protein ComK [Peptoniphilaceae bacterium]|nr:competence protein ComK [Peptoniphilaceae bacterium]MDY6018488.1 competence protein ComK [Anaerococcus sp.]